MPDFYQTLMGRQFYEGTMPRIAGSLMHIAKEMKKSGGHGRPQSKRFNLDVQLREKLVEKCAEDLFDTLSNDAKYREEVSRNGFNGFDTLSDDDLVQAFFDAGLNEINPDLEGSLYAERAENISAIAKDVLGLDSLVPEDSEELVDRGSIREALERAYEAGAGSVR